MMGEVAPIKKHGQAPADSGGDLDVFAPSYRPYANSLIIVKKQIEEVGSGFTASQNNKIGKIVDNFYIQLNTS